MDAEVIFFLREGDKNKSLRAEEQLGLTELTVNSCFSALSLFKYLKIFRVIPDKT